jgi:hypothetical protein
VIDIQLGRFYIADVLHNGKLIHVEGVADDLDEQTVTLAPSPTFQSPEPAKARVYLQQIVNIG